jgi:tRNA(Arg) A34 adenosine deaminase TadA
LEPKEPHYPDWIRDIVVPGQVHDDAALLRLAVQATLNGMKRAEGGPFGAIIATHEGKVVSVGTNLVVSGSDATAHAEVLAIRRAGQTLGTFRLRGSGVPGLKLLTTCEPCIMCVGAIHWAGIPEVIAAARKEDAERFGFVEGPSGFDTAGFLQERGILYRGDFLREEALQLFQAYEGELYNG